MNVKHYQNNTETRDLRSESITSYAELHTFVTEDTCIPRLIAIRTKSSKNHN